MPGAAGELTDVIDVRDHGVQGDAGALRRRLAARPAGHQHPGVEGSADDRAARHELTQLLVRELAIVRDEGAAVGVARPYRPAETVERFTQAVVAQMGDVEDQPEALHLAQEIAAARADASGSVVLGVDAGTVVRRADSAEPLLERALQMRERDDRI